MNNKPFIDNPIAFQQALKQLHLQREKGKLKNKRQYRLTLADRKIIHDKTAGKCHVCGDEVPLNKFEADHVQSHSSGGTSIKDNFLAACKTCNNYRWDYLPEEFQWIIKLGVWARTEIAKGSSLGNAMAKSYMQREKVREARRKNPRITSTI